MKMATFLTQEYRTRLFCNALHISQYYPFTCLLHTLTSLLSSSAHNLDNSCESWLITTTPPSNSSTASHNASIDCMSRWFVGSVNKHN
jgi:hypothetical protein